MGGTDYAQVHLRWTIPPALALWAGWRRFRTRRDLFKTTALCAIAITSTIPWDSYLIRNKIWSYPDTSIIGPTLLAIPLEEVFFFFIQTYITASLYTIVTKPVIHALHLPRNQKQAKRAVTVRLVGGATLLAIAAYAYQNIGTGRAWTYMCLIVAWAFPFLALLWAVASSHILSLWKHVMLTVSVPTIYLWVCDSCALRRGTWVIEQGTKLGLAAYGLEIEEAVFFLLTNMLVVFGMVACDYCLAVHDVSEHASNPTLSSLASTVIADPRDLPHDTLNDLAHCVHLLRVKSKSFYAGSILFEGKPKLDLLVLYAWCRVVDDMVDEPTESLDAKQAIELLRQYLDLVFDARKDDSGRAPSRKQIATLLSRLSAAQRPPFFLLATLPISRGPLAELIDGFETDAAFEQMGSAQVPFPTDDLMLKYASNVASSVADLCCQLVWHHYGCSLSMQERNEVVRAAREMGQALQLTNIARDVPSDLQIGRVYLPGLSRSQLEVEGGLESATPERKRLLKEARTLAKGSRLGISLLPRDVQGGMRSATDLYMSIAEAVDQALDSGDVRSRAGVSSWTRAVTIWKAMGA
ncbi:hypothetical protein ACM66B_006770 [Microbotryomycetes sp. NB124-2]